MLVYPSVELHLSESFISIREPEKRSSEFSITILYVLLDTGKIEIYQLNTADKIICTSISDWKQCPKCYLLQVFIKYALF